MVVQNSPSSPASAKARAVVESVPRQSGFRHVTFSRVPAAIRKFLLGPAFSLIPDAGWYKSAGHQLRWLHRLSFLGGSERYVASLSYFYFDTLQRRRLFTYGALDHLPSRYHRRMGKIGRGSVVVELVPFQMEQDGGQAAGPAA